MINSDFRKKMADSWFSYLQIQICKEFEFLENGTKKFKSKIPGTKKNNSYWASGISVVAHMKNPKIPAIHFNTRFVITSKSWFGGGMDVTPSFKDLNEKKLLHRKLKNLCKNN